MSLSIWLLHRNHMDRGESQPDAPDRQTATPRPRRPAGTHILPKWQSQVCPQNWRYLQNNAGSVTRDVRWREFPYEQNKLFSYSVIGKIASRCATRHGATPNWAKIPASIRPPSSPVLHSSGPLQIRSVPWLPQTDSSPSAAPRLPRTIGCRRRTNRLVPSTLHGGGG